MLLVGAGPTQFRVSSDPAVSADVGILERRLIVPAGGQFVAKTYSNDAGTRAYKLYVPNAYKGQPLPLIVMLHGSTQSADFFSAGTRMNTIAEECIFLVAYPEQPRSRQCFEGLELVPAGRPAAWPR